MTFDGTNVDVEELETYGREALGRAGSTASVSKAVAGVRLGSDMLGFFSSSFLAEASESQEEIASTIRKIATALTEDGNTAIANARDFETTNTTQANRFTNEELP